jgi:hypothetical protein
MDVEPTAETIDAAAKRFRQTADALDRIAERDNAYPIEVFRMREDMTPNAS